MEKETAPVRKQKRVRMAVPAFYELQSSRSEDEGRLSEGTVRDFSDSGIGLFTHTPLHRGEHITVFCEDIWNSGKSGTVLWCHEVHLRLFRVGVCLQ